jgi:hypothetical protein
MIDSTSTPFMRITRAGVRIDLVLVVRLDVQVVPVAELIFEREALLLEWIERHVVWSVPCGVLLTGAGLAIRVPAVRRPNVL